MIEYFKKYLFLIVVYAIFISLLFVLLVYLLKRKDKKNVVLRGFLMDLNTKRIWALSLVIVNFIFLSYVFTFKINLNVSIFVVSILLNVISFILCGNIKNVIINFFINVINLGIVYLGSIVQHLEIPSSSTHFLLKVATNVFGLLFYIFTLAKFTKNICLKEKNEKIS